MTRMDSLLSVAVLHAHLYDLCHLRQSLLILPQASKVVTVLCHYYVSVLILCINKTAHIMPLPLKTFGSGANLFLGMSVCVSLLVCESVCKSVRPENFVNTKYQKSVEGISSSFVHRFI